jgi:hypothetical protein
MTWAISLLGAVPVPAWAVVVGVLAMVLPPALYHLGKVFCLIQSVRVALRDGDKASGERALKIIEWLLERRRRRKP